MNGHPQQDASLLARAWAGILHVLTINREQWVNVAGLNRRNAVLEADAIIREFANSDPVTIDNEAETIICNICHVDLAMSKHAPSCVWQRARELTNKETKV